VRRGDIRHAVVVRTAKKLQRKDGSVVRFDDNACVLINKTGEPIGSRLNGEFTFSLLQRVVIVDVGGEQYGMIGALERCDDKLE
jgi:ribosomal protein L14